MKTRLIVFFALFQAVSAFGIDVKDLPEKYRVWLTEEVPYIITPIEKQVFLTLTTDKDHDFFIDAFWAQRDPTPGTPTNEFRDDHYRRIAYANTYFIDQPMKGWRTDRGRIYIILGAPKTVEHFAETLETVPVETWFYLGKTEYGFPSGFNVMFFQPHGMGGYRLYHPGSDGPASLFRAYKGDSTNYDQVYEDLKESDATLAEYSLSLLLGEREYRQGANIGSELLLSNIEAYPRKMIDSRYAEKVAKYKTQIESDYSLTFIECRYTVRIIRGASGRYFLHYAIEPKSLSVDQYEKKYFAAFNIYGKIEDAKGRLIYEFTKNHPMEFDEPTLNMVKANSMCLTDMFPVVPGHLKYTMLVKNVTSKEFSDLETTVDVPGETSGVTLLEPMLASRIDVLEGSPRPFQYDHDLPDIRPQHAYLRGTPLTLLFQIAGSPDGVKSVRAETVKGQETGSTVEKSLSEISVDSHYKLPLPTSDLVAGDYTERINLIGTNGSVIGSQSVTFSISPTSKVPTPWVYSKVLPADKVFVYDLIIADEYSRKGDDATAFSLYEDGAKNHPDVPEFQIGLARAFLAKKEYQRVIDILTPVVARPDFKNEEAFLFLAGAQQAARQYANAVASYNHYTALHGTDYRIMNAIGECYLAAGQKQDAVKTWQNSLKIFPDQPALKSRLAEVK